MPGSPPISHNFLETGDSNHKTHKLVEFFSRQLSLKSIQVYTGELYRRKRMLGLPDMLLYVVHTNLLVLTKNHTAKFRIIIVAEIGGPAPLMCA